MRRWINIKLLWVARRIALRIAFDKTHIESVRGMAATVAGDCQTIQDIITPR